MKIALASCPVITKNIAHNLSSMSRAIEQCGGKADMIVMGEAALQGFECLTWDYETDLHMAVSQDDPRIARICDAARRNQIAVSFGYIEKVETTLFSSQIVIDEKGTILHNFRRVSVGWKEYWHTDDHYQEGKRFEAFSYRGKRWAIGLCGDLWTEERPEEMRRLNADIVLWPVWCDYIAQRWNESVKYEYAQQAALCGDCVLYVNPFCADRDVRDAASGGAACSKRARSRRKRPPGKAISSSWIYKESRVPCVPSPPT